LLPISVGQKNSHEHRTEPPGSRQQSAGDAHRERKVRCDNNAGTTDSFSHDVVYKRFNGVSGFDAAMDQVADAYRDRSGVSVSVVRSRSPFVSTFRQCNETQVPWSGDVSTSS
jgi:hypothetical protein